MHKGLDLKTDKRKRSLHRKAQREMGGKGRKGGGLEKKRKGRCRRQREKKVATYQKEGGKGNGTISTTASLSLGKGRALLIGKEAAFRGGKKKKHRHRQWKSWFLAPSRREKRAHTSKKKKSRPKQRKGRKEVVSRSPAGRERNCVRNVVRKKKPRVDNRGGLGGKLDLVAEKKDTSFAEREGKKKPPPLIPQREKDNIA